MLILVQGFVRFATLLVSELFHFLEVNVDRCWDLLLSGPFPRLWHCISLGACAFKDVDRLEPPLLVQLARDGQAAAELVLKLVQGFIIIDA